MSELRERLLEDAEFLRALMPRVGGLTEGGRIWEAARDCDEVAALLAAEPVREPDGFVLAFMRPDGEWAVQSELYESKLAAVATVRAMAPIRPREFRVVPMSTGAPSAPPAAPVQDRQAFWHAGDNVPIPWWQIGEWLRESGHEVFMQPGFRAAPAQDALREADWRLDCAAVWASGRVMDELRRAWGKFPEQNTSLHHAYAVLLEESDELWHAIKHEGHIEVRAEAVQVAAMALRLLVDCYGYCGAALRAPKEG